jgi:hypothetical protein
VLSASQECLVSNKYCVGKEKKAIYMSRPQTSIQRSMAKKEWEEI